MTTVLLEQPAVAVMVVVLSCRRSTRRQVRLVVPSALVADKPPVICQQAGRLVSVIHHGQGVAQIVK